MPKTYMTAILDKAEERGRTAIAPLELARGPGHGVVVGRPRQPRRGRGMGSQPEWIARKPSDEANGDDNHAIKNRQQNPGLKVADNPGRAPEAIPNSTKHNPRRM